MTQIQAWRFTGISPHPLPQHAHTFGADAAKVRAMGGLWWRVGRAMEAVPLL
ncbi:hypothetical protein [Delftia acidovorans]|uniref:hypothetical protein n=1 Tax=Delftia acidovorans TaxID=80866 RepID=UPI00148333E4|nr:hypothetical protein [Delftia acidovorans]